MANFLFRILTIGLSLSGLFGTYWLQSQIDRFRGKYPEEQEFLYFSSGTRLRKLALGNEGLFADIYWMRAVQYYGDKRLRHDGNFPLLFSLIDIATTLDPSLMESYQFGAIFLSEASPIGAASPQKAVALLKKGIEANPDSWQLEKHLGFVYYWYLKDYNSAAQAFLIGSKKPHAAPWMKTMAASLLAFGGNRQSSMFLWKQIYDSADTASLRENALQNLIKLRVEDDIEKLQEIVDKISHASGKRIESFQELVNMGVLKELPRDPMKFSYWIEPSTGKVRLNPQSPIGRS